MSLFESQQPIRQLEPRKGSYYYVVIPAAVVQTFPRQRHTRLLCTLEGLLTFPCGLNHLGDGNFFIILSTKNLKTLSKTLGESIHLAVTEDPNPLGVERPEVLEVLLSQQDDLRKKFEHMTPGKQRSIIYAIKAIKDLDIQVSKALELITEGGVRRKPG